MTALRRSALALGAAVCAVTIASGSAADAFATTAPQAPAHTVAQQHTVAHEAGAAAEGAVSAQSALRRQWGPSSISGDYLTHHGKKWVSQPYRSKGRTAYAYLQCRNSTTATMRVRIYNVEAQQYIANSGWVTCNPHKAFHTKTRAFQRLDHLRIVIDGDRDSKVWASYRR
jgi:hypothetical protein